MRSFHRTEFDHYQALIILNFAFGGTILCNECAEVLPEGRVMADSTFQPVCANGYGLLKLPKTGLREI